MTRSTNRFFKRVMSRPTNALITPPSSFVTRSMSEICARANLCLAILIPVAVILFAPAVHADESESWFSSWMNHVTAIKNQQPHWVTPLVTVTPRLEQEIRADVVDQKNPQRGREVVNYGNGKGLELIPLDNVEVILNAPPYFVRRPNSAANGFGDFAALVKYRLLSNNKESGDNIVTAFLGASFPTGEGSRRRSRPDKGLILSMSSRRLE